MKRFHFDIVLYNKNYPRLSIGGITAFLAESVVATIEIKSTFKEEHLISAIEAAQKTKEFDPDWRNTMSSGYIPPKIINYLVAYQCDIKNMSIVFGWIKKFYKRAEICDKDTFLHGCNPREKIACKVLDGIFILQKGFILFDNVPLPFIINKVQTKQHPGWVISESKHGNLATLFHHLLAATSNIQIKCLNPHSYFKDFQPEIIAHTI